MKKIALLLSLVLTCVFSMSAQQKFTKALKPKITIDPGVIGGSTIALPHLAGAFYAEDGGIGNYYFIATSVESEFNSETGAIELYEAGWSIAFDLYAAPSSPIKIPLGEYVVSDSGEEFTCHPEYCYAMYINANGDMESYQFNSNVIVSKNEKGQTEFKATIDQGGKTTTFIFTGDPAFEETNSSQGVLPRFRENLDLNFTGSLGYYDGNLFQSNTGSLRLNLYDCEFDGETGSHTGVGHCLQLSLFNILFGDPKNAKVRAGVYKMARNFAKETWFPGMEIDYMGMTTIMGTFCQRHDANGNFSYCFIADGTVVIEELGDGIYKITVDLTTDEGYYIRGTYEGAITRIIDQSDDQKGAVISTLEEDLELDLNGIDTARVWKTDDINGCSRFYLDIGSPSGRDEFVAKNGGDIFRIDMLTELGSGYFPCGVYTVMEENYKQYYKPFALRRGFFEDGGDLRGTRWFHFTEDGRYMIADGLAPAYGGTVTLSIQPDGNYKIDIAVIDDAGFNITGQWTGPVVAMFDVPVGIDKALAEAEYTYLDSETILLGNVAANEAVNVYATNGALVKSQMGNGTISLSNLPKGVYLIKATNKQTFKVAKR